MTKRRFLCIFAIGVFAASGPSAWAVGQETDKTDPVESEASQESVPEGLIVVKILPADTAGFSRQRAAPRAITDRRDPEYVRCRLEPVPGSILKKRKICMTNREWNLAIRLGNKYAREFVADNQPGFMLQ